MGDDKQLVRRWQAGERQAFEEFVDTYGGRVHRLVRRYVVNPSDAEDVTQEVFCALHRSIGSFKGQSALSTWVYRVTVNHCLRHIERRKGDNLPLDEQVLPDADWHSDPSRAYSKQELSDQLQHALHQLSPGHANVVVLCELHGLSYQECSQILNIPVGTVKSRMFTAFRRLRDLLSEYVEGSDDLPNDPGDAKPAKARARGTQRSPATSGGKAGG